MSAIGLSAPQSGTSTFGLERHSRPTGGSVSVVPRVWKATIVAVAIVSSAALLIAQQIAFRLLAPVIGSSVETWSAIIGVILLGIAMGNHFAGKLADRISPVLCISVGLFFGALSVFLMPFIADWLTDSTQFGSLSLTVQIFSASFLVCFLPGVMLSLVTPPSIRSVVTNPNEVGSAAGQIFAWGTFGSLAGNYLAGFVLLV